MMTHNDKPVVLTQAALQALLEDAAEVGATKALTAIGLHDEAAVHDVHELRGVLEAFRAAKASMLTAAVKFLTVTFLAAIIAGLGFSALSKN